VNQVEFVGDACGIIQPARRVPVVSLRATNFTSVALDVSKEGYRDEANLLTRK